MSDGSGGLLGRIILVPLLAVGIGLGIFVPEALFSEKPAKAKVSEAQVAAKPLKKVPVAAVAGHAVEAPSITEKKKAAKPKKPVVAALDRRPFLEVAKTSAWSRFGPASLRGAEIAVKTECAAGYAVVIWRNESALTSVEIYLRDSGRGYRVIAGHFTRYPGSLGNQMRKSFGAIPADLSCFES